MTRVPPIVVVVALVALAAACGGGGGGASPVVNTPTNPTPTPPSPPPPTTSTVTVNLTATNGGRPLAGIAASLAGTTSTTDASGQFTATLPLATTSAAIEFSGPSIVPRRLTLATRTRTVALDAIELAGGFSLAYYRQLVRNGFQQPAALQPVLRLTDNPRLYIRTVFGSSNRAVDASSLDTVAATVAAAVNEFTGGRLSLAAVERGTETHVNDPGWITVNWTEDLGDRVCGSARVGGNPGIINLHPRNDGCRCPGDPAQVSRWVIRHEVGHALGFWHTDSREDVMFDTFNACLGGLSARERLHAPIAYARPRGNVDPDTDPVSIVALLPQTPMVR